MKTNAPLVSHADNVIGVTFYQYAPSLEMIKGITDTGQSTCQLYSGDWGPILYSKGMVAAARSFISIE